MKTILDLTYNEAKEFFLKEENYFSVELPEYFIFQGLLENLDKELLNKDLKKDLGTAIKVRDLDDVNYKILNNKDGKLSWRPFQLIHPAIYVNLVHNVTEEKNWETIVNQFKLFSENTNIECHSIPVTENTEKSAKENQIYEWWQNVEQRSILMALEYNHVLHLDITDCYGALYTHSIVWALHGKEDAKKPENRNKQEFIGNVIDWGIQDMSNGQTNGIPQGSVLMDFIAEIVLGYGDLLLTERLKEKDITDYKIIRYRDDYRIFTKNEQQSAEIAKEADRILAMDTILPAEKHDGVNSWRALKLVFIALCAEKGVKNFTRWDVREKWLQLFAPPNSCKKDSFSILSISSGLQEGGAKCSSNTKLAQLLTRWGFGWFPTS